MRRWHEKLWKEWKLALQAEYVLFDLTYVLKVFEATRFLHGRGKD